ncbi:hypothetical protein HLI18_32710 [Rhizobium laguerreae]|uniref:hypothetical protein n=1 Tax=Rhizobium laguerreae TaxID=1076926 RepID=UPI001478F203|nr:hypothetical protein [Rhizobium laguerreae]NNG74529.1 hypothetical protein [Rhizobium laguerreae]
MKWPISFRLTAFLGRLLYRLARFLILMIGFTLLIIFVVEPIIRKPSDLECSKQSTIARQTLNSFPTFASSDVFFRLSGSSLQNALNQVAGSRLKTNGKVFDVLEVDARFGRPAISMDFCAANARIPVDLRVWQIPLLRLEADSLLAYESGRYVQEKPIDDAMFKIDFRYNVQKFRLRYSWWEALANWFPKVFGHIEQAMAAIFPSMTVPVEVPASFTVDLGMKNTEVVEFEKLYLKSRPEGAPKEIGGKVTLALTIPSSPVTTYLDFNRPVFSPAGVWLLAKTVDQIPASGPTSVAQPDRVPVEQAETWYKKAGNGFTNGAEASLWINNSAINRLANRIGNLPEASRTISVVSIAREGNLGEIAAKDDNLGQLFSLKAEVPEDNAWSGTAVATLSAAANDRGVSLAGNVNVTVNAKIRLTVKGPIGGPLSVDSNVAGSATTPIGGDVKAFTQDVAGFRSVYWGIDLSCTSADAHLSASGGQFEGIPIKYGDIKAELAIPMFKKQVRPSIMVDGLPVRIALAQQTNGTAGERKPNLVAFAPSVPGLDMTFQFGDVQQLNGGTEISTNVSFAPADAATWSEAQLAARVKARDAIRVVNFPGERPPCPPAKPSWFSVDNITSDDVAKVIEILGGSIKTEKERLKAIEDLSKLDFSGAAEHYKKSLESQVQQFKNVLELGKGQLDKVGDELDEFRKKPVDKTFEKLKELNPF